MFVLLNLTRFQFVSCSISSILRISEGGWADSVADDDWDETHKYWRCGERPEPAQQAHCHPSPRLASFCDSVIMNNCQAQGHLSTIVKFINLREHPVLWLSNTLSERHSGGPVNKMSLKVIFKIYFSPSKPLWGPITSNQYSRWFIPSHIRNFHKQWQNDKWQSNDKC